MRFKFGKPLIGDEEINAVSEVLRGDILVHGPKAEEFEIKFCEFSEASHSVSVSSCTAGLHLIYFCLGIGPGDEVIVPAQTHVATAHAVELVGATAVFADVEKSTGNICPNSIREQISSKTKAICVVHYLGVPCDMSEILAIARENELKVVEDCALAVGSTIEATHVGLFGDAGVFSFYPVKHFTTAEGGIVITKDEGLAADVKLARAFGVDRTHSERKVAGMYDAKKLGFNYRMSEVHAAIGCVQLSKIRSFLEARRDNFNALKAVLEGKLGLSIYGESRSSGSVSSHYCLVVRLPETLVSSRAEIIEDLKQNGVGSSIYYPQPVPRMSYYQEKYRYDPGVYANAAMLSDETIALPVAPHLSIDDMNEIGRIVTDVFNRWG